MENYTKARKGFTREIVLSGKCKGCQYIQKHEYYKKLTTRDNGEKVISHTPLKRSNLRSKGKSATSVIKDEIQALLRACVIKRDGGCILRGHGNCTEVLQGEHLITRATSGYYGDLRNLVCLCSYHHIFFKPQYSQIYWEYVREKIGPVRWAWYEFAKEDRTAHKMDWQLVKLSLELELQKPVDKMLGYVKS